MGDEIYDLTQRDLGYGKEEEEDQGEWLGVKDILGKKIVVYRYDLRDSDYHEGQYAMIDIDVEEENGMIDHKRILTTSSKVLLEQLERWVVKMPFRATIEQREGGKWKYFSFKPIK